MGMTLKFKRGAVPDDLLRALGELVVCSAQIEYHIKLILYLLENKLPDFYGAEYEGLQGKRLEAALRKCLAAAELGAHRDTIMQQCHTLLPRLREHRWGRDAAMHDLAAFWIEGQQFVRIQSRKRGNAPPIEPLMAARVVALNDRGYEIDCALIRFYFNLARAMTGSEPRFPDLALGS